MDNDKPAPENADFPSTTWTLVEELQYADESRAAKALDRVLSLYHRPLHTFILRKFKVPHDQASDWLQSFVWKKILLNKLLKSAKRSRGKFRNFLATALENFIRDEIKKDGRKLRHPEGGLLPLDMAGMPDIPARTGNHEFQFDVAWGQGILDEAFRRMEAECLGNGRERIWKVFQFRLVEPLLHGTEPVAYKEFCAQLDFRNDTEAGNALITAKRMFARVLRSVIREYARDEQEVELEIRELLAAFAKN